MGLPLDDTGRPGGGGIGRPLAATGGVGRGSALGDGRSDSVGGAAFADSGPGLDTTRSGWLPGPALEITRGAGSAAGSGVGASSLDPPSASGVESGVSSTDSSTEADSGSVAGCSEGSASATTGDSSAAGAGAGAGAVDPVSPAWWAFSETIAASSSFSVDECPFTARSSDWQNVTSSGFVIWSSFARA